MDDDREFDELASLTGALLAALEAFAFAARRLNPPDLPALVEAVGAPDEPLAEALARAAGWRGQAAVLREPLAASADTRGKGRAAVPRIRLPSQPGPHWRAMRPAPTRQCSSMRHDSALPSQAQ